MAMQVHIGAPYPTGSSPSQVTIPDSAVQPTPAPPQAINDIWEALQPIPPSYTSSYAFRMSRAASTVYNPVDAAIVEAARDASYILKDSAVPSTTTILDPPAPAKPGEFNEGGYTSYDLSPHYVANLVMTARNNVMKFILAVNSFVSRAKNAGFAPPNNPFIVIMNLSKSSAQASGLIVGAGAADDLLTNINIYGALLLAEAKGQIDLKRHIVAAVQVGNLTMSSFGGTGNTGVDLAKLIPDADAIKRQKAADALAAFDFKKRVPKVLFTANYNPQRESKGCIVGWKRIPDASGYIVKRTSIFDGSSKSFTLSNDSIISQTQRLIDFLRVWVLGFYDTFDERLVSCYLDPEIERDQFYTYSVQAYQKDLGTFESLFDVPMVPANISVPQMNAIRAAMAKLQRTEFESEPDIISPYPIISQFLLGSTQHDWILAGLNSRASRIRNDDPTVTRKFSYIGAQLNFLFGQATAGKLMIPAPGALATVANTINSSIASAGVAPVIKAVLDETGALFYFDGHDSKRDPNFKRFELDKIDSVILSAVFGAIDSENATLSLKAIAANMPSLLTVGLLDADSVLTTSKPKQTSKPTEIKVPANKNDTSLVRSEDELQFFKEFNEDQVIDLVTFEGISKMMRAIRILSDISTNGRWPATPGDPPVPAPGTVVSTIKSEKK